jgi:hypothetical protein
MKIQINETDVVTHNDKGQVVKVDKPNTVVRVTYRDDGSVWMMDSQIK